MGFKIGPDDNFGDQAQGEKLTPKTVNMTATIEVAMHPNRKGNFLPEYEYGTERA